MNNIRFKASHDSITHYTNSDGLLGILNKDKGSIVLRFTHADYLNDAKEGKELSRIFSIAINDLLDDGEITIEQFNELKEINFDKSQNFALTKEGLYGPQMASTTAEADVYICCFCSEEDLLEMWRYYSKGSTGYSITFSKGTLKKSVNEDYVKEGQKEYQCTWDAVIYDDKDKINVVKTVIKRNIEYNGGVDVIRWQLIDYQYIFKHSCFVNEHEIRSILKVPKRPIWGDSVRPIEIKQRLTSRGMVAYVELEFPKRALRAVKCAPTANDNEEAAVKDYIKGYMDSSNSGIKVDRSKLPIRF